MPISDLQKAAVLLSSLPQEQGEALLDRLDPKQAAAVTDEIQHLREIQDVEQEAVVLEFAAARAAHLDKRRPAQAAPFEFLHDIDSDDLLDLIAEEHPQTIALVLSYLPPRQAAAAIAGLSPESQLPVVYRMATIEQPSPEIVRDVEKGLQSRMTDEDASPANSRGVSSVVRMLNVMEPATERRLLDELAEAAPELVREIRRTMFGIDVADRGIVDGEPGLAEAAC